MSKKKIAAEDRIEAAKAFCEGRMNQVEISRLLGVSTAVVQRWIARYKAQGVSAFKELSHNTIYTAGLKRAAVEDYLSGAGSLTKIAAKYGLRSPSQLEQWIKLYNSGKDFNRKMSGGCRMKQGRDTAQEERIVIAKECLENGSNYGETAARYNVSYQQVYTWVKKFKEMGEAGLEDRRGKRTAAQEPRTELEAAKIEIERLKRELYLTKVERDLLKKLDELERRDAYHK